MLMLSDSQQSCNLFLTLLTELSQSDKTAKRISEVKESRKVHACFKLLTQDMNKG